MSPVKDSEDKNRARSILDNIDSFSKNKLKQREDLSRLIEIAIQQNKMNKLEEITFSAKYVQGLLKIVKSRSEDIDPEYFIKIEKEYLENLQKLKRSLAELIYEAGSFYRGIFEEKYFSLTQGSLQNLTDLCSDLNWTKMYFNELKRK